MILQNRWQVAATAYDVRRFAIRFRTLTTVPFYRYRIRFHSFKQTSFFLSDSHSNTFSLKHSLYYLSRNLSLLFTSSLIQPVFFSLSPSTLCVPTNCMLTLSLTQCLRLPTFIFNSIFRRLICYRYLPVTHWLPFYAIQPTYSDQCIHFNDDFDDFYSAIVWKLHLKGT